VPQYEFNFQGAHSYRTFSRLLQLLFCRRYDNHGKHTLQNALGECNCKTGSSVIVRIALHLFKIIQFLLIVNSFFCIIFQYHGRHEFLILKFHNFSLIFKQNFVIFPNFQ